MWYGISLKLQNIMHEFEMELIKIKLLSHMKYPISQNRIKQLASKPPGYSIMRPTTPHPLWWHRWLPVTDFSLMNGLTFLQVIPLT